MTTDTEIKIRRLKAAIKKAANPLEKSNLRFELQTKIKALARQHEAEKVRRFAGNQF